MPKSPIALPCKWSISSSGAAPGPAPSAAARAQAPSSCNWLLLVVGC